MKKIGYIIMSVILLMSCSSDESKIRGKAEKIVKENMNDPKSYELVGFEKEGVLTWNDCIDNRIRLFQSSLDYYTAEKNKIEIKYYKSLISGMNYIKKKMGEKASEVAITNYVLRIRGNNKLGSKVLSDFYVQVLNDGKFEVLNLVSEKSKLYDTLTDELPGYSEVLKKCDKIKGE
jgi:hypothetical protein